MAVARGTVPIIPHSPITKSRGLQVITIDQCRVHTHTHTHSVGLQHWSAQPSLQGRWCVSERRDNRDTQTETGRKTNKWTWQAEKRQLYANCSWAERITAVTVTLRVYLKCNIMSLKMAGIVKDETSCSEAFHPVTSHREPVELDAILTFQGSVSYSTKLSHVCFKLASFRLITVVGHAVLYGNKLCFISH